MQRRKAFLLCLLFGLFAAFWAGRVSVPVFSYGAASFMAHADPLKSSSNSGGGAADQSSAVQARSPESDIDPPPPNPCNDCPPGEACSGYTIPAGSDSNCLRGVCNASCQCEADFMDGVGCKDATQKECIKTEFLCRQGKCEGISEDLAPPAPPQRCWEEEMWGQLYARRNNWGLTFPACIWSESFSNVPKPADTCTLNESKDALLKMTSQLNSAWCVYEGVVVAGYPKGKPPGCQTCTPDTSVEKCDWVKGEDVPQDPTPTPTPTPGPSCGNGELDVGEQCDPGLPSTCGGCGCNPDCTKNCNVHCQTLFTTTLGKQGTTLRLTYGTNVKLVFDDGYEYECSSHPLCCPGPMPEFSTQKSSKPDDCKEGKLTHEYMLGTSCPSSHLSFPPLRSDQTIFLKTETNPNTLLQTVVLPPTVVVSGVCYTNNPGEVHTCVDAASGGIVWQKPGNVPWPARAP